MIARRTLGAKGPSVSAIGFGAMVIAPGISDAVHDEDSLATLHRTLDLGMNFIDTADIYGNGHSERLVGRAIAGRREEEVPNDFRGSVPWFDGNNFAHNVQLLDELTRLAESRRVTAAQLALAWLLHQGPDIVPSRGHAGSAIWS